MEDIYGGYRGKEKRPRKVMEKGMNCFSAWNIASTHPILRPHLVSPKVIGIP